LFGENEQLIEFISNAALLSLAPADGIRRSRRSARTACTVVQALMFSGDFREAGRYPLFGQHLKFPLYC
jgi:hypothetical protein